MTLLILLFKSRHPLRATTWNVAAQTRDLASGALGRLARSAQLAAFAKNGEYRCANPALHLLGFVDVAYENTMLGIIMACCTQKSPASNAEKELIGESGRVFSFSLK